MKKITIADIVARCLMQQLLTIVEGEVASPTVNQLFKGTTADYLFSGSASKQTVHAIIPRGDVLYIYVDKES